MTEDCHFVVTHSQPDVSSLCSTILPFLLRPFRLSFLCLTLSLSFLLLAHPQHRIKKESWLKSIISPSINMAMCDSHWF